MQNVEADVVLCRSWSFYNGGE